KSRQVVAQRVRVHECREPKHPHGCAIHFTLDILPRSPLEHLNEIACVIVAWLDTLRQQGACICFRRERTGQQMNQLVFIGLFHFTYYLQPHFSNCSSHMIQVSTTLLSELSSNPVDAS